LCGRQMLPLEETCLHYRKLLSDNGNIWLSIIGKISQFNPISKSEVRDLPLADFPYSSSWIPSICRQPFSPGVADQLLSTLHEIQRSRRPGLLWQAAARGILRR